MQLLLDSSAPRKILLEWFIQIATIETDANAYFSGAISTMLLVCIIHHTHLVLNVFLGDPMLNIYRRANPDMLFRKFRVAPVIVRKNL